MDKTLIEKIKHNKTIENERDELKRQTTDGTTYVPGTSYRAETARADLAESKRDEWKGKYNTCVEVRDQLQNDNDALNNDLSALETSTTSAYNTLQARELACQTELSRLNEDLKDPTKWRTAEDYKTLSDEKVALAAELNDCIIKNNELEGNIDGYVNNWVQRGAATYTDLSLIEKSKYGEIGSNEGQYGEITDLIPDQNLNDYIRKRDCTWNLASDKDDYGEIGSTVGKYGKITNSGVNMGINEGYIRKGDCIWAIADDNNQYGKKNTFGGDWGLIGDTPGSYGQITDLEENMGSLSGYIRKGDCTWAIADDKRNYGEIGDDKGQYGEITDANGSGNKYILKSLYDQKVTELSTCEDRTQLNDVTSINQSSGNELRISGNKLLFDGESVKFTNELCIKADGGQEFCLTPQHIRDMNAAPCGERGPDGTCADAVSSSSPFSVYIP